MPMECPRCQFITDDANRSICPECGARMRLSLLRDVQENAAKPMNLQEKEPGLFSFVGQWLIAFILSQVIIAFGGYAFILCVALMGTKPVNLPTTHPAIFICGTYAVTLVGVAIGVMMALPRVSLAPTIGLWVGLASPIGMMLMRDFLIEWNAPWTDWVLLPALGTVVGYLFGVRAAAMPEKVEPEEDPLAPPKEAEALNAPQFSEMRVRFSVRWAQLCLGVLVGRFADGGLNSLIRLLMRLKSGLNPATIEGMLSDSQLLLSGIAYLLGGMLAGAWTKSGFIQGMLCGFGIYGLRLVLVLFGYASVGLPELAFMVFIASIGGMIGRRLFPPYRLYRGHHDRPDEVVREM
ncbi:hypothetical protein Pan216_18390 [Planctomycetes bacterium Pan216]|uniref:Uncharacterized protein n=1 Tax=Kolteria novifilia TaxID=2527975 RepID=A0A518B226_9BACT|nr:hypothetical protein Pan216_18390 [Planctomycetes bacterium Pan216]